MKYINFLFVFFILFVSPSYGFENCVTDSDNYQKVISNFTYKLSSLCDNQNIAIVYDAQNRETSEFLESTTSDLVSNIVSLPCKVMERKKKNLKVILDEMKLQMSGLTNNDVKMLGEWSTADMVGILSISDTNKYKKIYLRVSRVVDGSVVLSDGYNICNKTIEDYILDEPREGYISNGLSKPVAK
jgi:hypothetical protein